MILSENKTLTRIHATQCQEFYENVKRNAESIGISVNDKKTQLLCLSAANSADTKSYIRLKDGTKIESQETLKILGHHFGESPDLDVNLNKLSIKFRSRIWILRHLKKAGLPCEDLTKMYKCFLLNILDYTCVVYHPMINKTQAHRLEMLQKAALKVIYGYKLLYAELLEITDLETLADRRQRLTDSFILKTVEQETYYKEKWFPRHPFYHHDLCKELIFEEEYARTTRLYNAPIFYYRHRLNEIYDLSAEEEMTTRT